MLGGADRTMFFSASDKVPNPKLVVLGKNYSEWTFIRQTDEVWCLFLLSAT